MPLRASILAAILFAALAAHGQSLDKRAATLLDACTIEAAFADSNPTALWIPRENGYCDLINGLSPTNAATNWPAIDSDGFNFVSSHPSLGNVLDFGYPALLEPGTGSYSMAAWVKIRSFATGGIIGKSLAGNACRWSIHSGDTGPNVLWQGTSGGNVYTNFGTATTSNVWAFVMTTFDSTTKTVTAHLNGTRLWTATASTNSFTYTAGVTVPFRMGSYNYHDVRPYYFFDGWVYAAAVWRRAVPLDEAQSLYERSHP
jgi:hypothetical protein